MACYPELLNYPIRRRKARINMLLFSHDPLNKFGKVSRS